MNLISGIDVTASALNAQKTRLDIVAQNIANAQTTRGPDGRPDGKPGPEDLVIDTGNADGLKVAPLADQGDVRIMVLRPR